MEKINNYDNKKEFTQQNGLKNFINNISNFQTYLTCFTVSTYVGYKYLKNQEIYSEHHGHFNSPTKKLNKTLSGFHLKDAYARFFLSFVSVFIVIKIIKYSLMDDENNDYEKYIAKKEEIIKYYDNLKKEEKHIEDEVDKKINKNETKFQFEDHEGYLGKKEQDKFNLESSIRSRDFVNKYLNKENNEKNKNI